MNLATSDDTITVIKAKEPPYDILVKTVVLYSCQTKNPSLLTGLLFGRVEHTLNELLKYLFEDYSNTVGVLEELRNACNTKPKAKLVEKLVY